MYLRDYRYYNALPTVSFIIPTLDRPEGLQRCITSIKALNYPQNLIDIKVIDGEGTVPRKVKRGKEETKGDYIVYAANDTEFTPDSLMIAYLEGKDLVAFNTGEILPDEGNICEHFLIKRNDEDIFDTDFHHVGCDNYLWAEYKGRRARSKNAIVHHYHFTKGYNMDEVYKKGWSHIDEDRKLLKEKLSKLHGISS